MAETTMISLFDRAARSMVSELVNELAKSGYPQIRPAHSRVFEYLGPGGERVTSLAIQAQMTHPAMSELVADLEAMGFVHRRPDPEDGRARIVELTASGRRLQRHALQVIDDIESRWFGGTELDDGELIRALRPAIENAILRRRGRT